MTWIFLISAWWQLADITLWVRWIQFFLLDFECNCRHRFHLLLVQHWHFYFFWFWDEKDMCLLKERRDLGLTSCLTLQIVLLNEERSRKINWGKCRVERRMRPAGQSLSWLMLTRNWVWILCKANNADLCHALEAHMTDSYLLYFSLKFMCLQHSLFIIASHWCSRCLDSPSAI